VIDLAKKILVPVVVAAILGTFGYVWRSHDLLVRLDERDKAREAAYARLEKDLKQTREELRGVTDLFTRWMLQHEGVERP